MLTVPGSDGLTNRGRSREGGLYGNHIHLIQQVSDKSKRRVGAGSGRANGARQYSV